MRKDRKALSMLSRFKCKNDSDKFADRSGGCIFRVRVGVETLSCTGTSRSKISFKALINLSDILHFQRCVCSRDCKVDVKVLVSVVLSSRRLST